MRQSKLFIPTLKEAPTEAQMISHKLMLRSGLIRGLAAGIYSFLPLGWRSMKKASQIIREEIDNIGGQEFLLPALNPIEIWEQTGRVEAMGDVMFHIKNREGLVLAPTHEEIITYHARQHIKSYKELPQIWYQIQTKFRNEARPKSGLIRGRQFTMKDAYSMDATWEGLDESYQKHYEAYNKIFKRAGLKFFVVGAATGAMGGRASQEFMVGSPAGEDNCAVCYKCGYAANVEAANSGVKNIERTENNNAIEKFATPNAKSIDEVSSQFNVLAERCAKSMLYIVDSEPVLCLMSGNDELNEAKLQTALKANNLRPAEAEEMLKYMGANAGSLGPVGTKSKITIYADLRLRDANDLVSGANEDGFHIKNVDLSRDVKIDEYYDLRTVVLGEPCPKCGEPLEVETAIELGHIFKLGTKYSEALGAKFLDADGKENPLIMGSYGIGVERVLACYVEQNFDEAGIKWNFALAPFNAHLLVLGGKKFPEAIVEGDKLYAELEAAGIETLYDDRECSPGIKFADADLLGMPVQIVVGERNLKNGEVELKDRRTGERSLVKLTDIVRIVKEMKEKELCN